jgi:hypothetical protein
MSPDHNKVTLAQESKRFTQKYRVLTETTLPPATDTKKDLKLNWTSLSQNRKKDITYLSLSRKKDILYLSLSRKKSFCISAFLERKILCISAFPERKLYVFLPFQKESFMYFCLSRKKDIMYHSLSRKKAFCILAFLKRKILCISAFPERKILCYSAFPEKKILCISAFPARKMLCISDFPERKILCISDFPARKMLCISDFPERKILCISIFPERKIYVSQPFQHVLCTLPCLLHPCSPVHACVQTAAPAAAFRKRRPLRVVAEVRVAEAGKDGAGAVVGDVPLGAVGQRHQRVVYGAEEDPRGEALPQRRWNGPSKINGFVATLFVFIFLLQYKHSYNQSLVTLAEPLLHIFIAAGWVGGTSLECRDSNSGSPYSKPAHYHLSSAASYWATLHPTELRCILLSYAASYWATLHPTELRCILLSYAAPTELRCTIVSYAAQQKISGVSDATGGKCGYTVHNSAPVKSIATKFVCNNFFNWPKNNFVERRGRFSWH